MARGNKRGVILQALEKILKGRRFDEITMDEVAATGGVGKGTIYRYFDNKEDLFCQMVFEFLKEEIDAISVVAAASAHPRDKLVKVGESMSHHIILHGKYIRQMHAQTFTGSKLDPNEIMHDHHKRLDRILTQILTDAQSAGIVRKDFDIDATICVYKGMVMSRSMRLITGDGDIAIKRLVDLLMAGLSPIK